MGSIAHQGGWDESAFVIVPLVIFGVLLIIAKRRAEREANQERDASNRNEPPTS